MTHDFFITPADAIKQRMQLCKNLTFRKALSDIRSEGGNRALFRSYAVTLSMNMPYAAVVVCVNENLKTHVQPWDRANPHAWYFFCAGIAGGAAAFATNPFDVVRTRL